MLQSFTYMSISRDGKPGCRMLAVPQNAILSSGWMFPPDIVADFLLHILAGYAASASGKVQVV